MSESDKQKGEGGLWSGPWEADGVEEPFIATEVWDVAGLAPGLIKTFPPISHSKLIEARPGEVGDKSVDEFLRRAEYEELDPGHFIDQDRIGLLISKMPGKIQTYADKLRAEVGKGKKNESASYGRIKLLGQRAVAYAMHRDFMVGSFGVVAGTYCLAASDLAVEEQSPLITALESGGARQQEAGASLDEMHRLNAAIRFHKERTNQPNIAALFGNVYGGVSASIAPNADFIVATPEVNYGFSGVNVINAYGGEEVPEGAQSVEANLKNRNIDVLARDLDELEEFLAGVLRIADCRGGLTRDDIIPKDFDVSRFTNRQITFGPDGVAPALFKNQKAERSFDIKVDPEPDSLEGTEERFKRYKELLREPDIVDTEYLIQTVFDEAIPLYNHYVSGTQKEAPAVIGAIARIGSQAFIVLGDQPSYQQVGDSIRKVPSNSHPEHYEYRERLLEMGERLGIPVVCFVDTPGAAPTIDAERRGQSRKISRASNFGDAYKHALYTYVTGIYGSGGGIASGPRGQFFAMLERAQYYVAEPGSMTAILYSTQNPTDEQIKLSLETCKPTAKDQEDLGISDATIKQGRTSFETAMNVRKSLVTEHMIYQDMSEAEIAADREEKLRRPPAIPIAKGKKHFWERKGHDS